MAHRAVPISVSIALGHMPVNALEATAGRGLIHWQLCVFNFPTPFSYVECQAR